MGIFFGLLLGVLILTYYLSWKPRPFKDFYLSNPLWFAHRGLKTEAGENTVAAFEQASQAGFPAWEVDVLSTADGEVVCSHNFDLERETDGFGYIDELNLVDLKKIKSRRGIKISGKLIPTLDQVLKIKPKETRLIVEIKTRKILDFKTAARVIRIIKNRKLQKYTIITSFNPLTIWFVKWVDRRLYTGLNLENIKYFWWANVVHPDCLNPSAELVTRSLIARAGKKKLPLNVWTVNSRPAIKWLLQLKVEGIITDRSEFVL